MTPEDTPPHSRDANAPEFCQRSVPRKKKRAQGMPGDDLTHGPPATRKAGGSHHRFGRINRHSLRNGFNRLCRARPGETGFCVTVACRSSSANLAPATRAPGRHAFVVRNLRASSKRTRRVHRIPPHDRDDAFAPLVEAGRQINAPILGKTEAKYFSFEDWTNPIFFGFA
jgi:hypothetical protein